MSPINDLVERHVEAMLAEARVQGLPADVLGRKLLAQVVRIYSMTRSWDDIAAELQFTADNLDPDTEFAFIRP
ncbi:MAG: hypothetical protein AB7O49_21350 [Sphingomonadales bacterium]